MRTNRLVLLFLLGLAGAVLASGVLLAYARHAHRAQFRIMQELIAERDELEMEWGALQLERAATMGYLRIDREARNRLGMREPDRQDIVFLRVRAPDQRPERLPPGGS